MRRFLFSLCFTLIGFVVLAQPESSQNTIDSTLGISTTNKLLDSINVTVAIEDTAKMNKRQPVIEKLTPVYDFLSTRKILWAIVVLILTYFGIRIGTNVLGFFAEKSTTYRFTIKGLIPLFRILSWSVAITFIVAAIFAPDFATIIAFSASIGVAVGFAAQDIIKNIFGGVMIIFDQPFKVGDKIEIGNYYGEVLEIGLRSTRIVTADDSVVSVPNAEVMNQSVSNSNSGEPNCQVVAELYLPMDIDTEKVRNIAIEGAQVSRFIYLQKPIVVLFFQEIKDRKSYLKMRLKAYVMDIRYEFAFKSDMTELVLEALLKEGIIDKKDYN
jgi:MscS family membrane protein